MTAREKGRPVMTTETDTRPRTSVEVNGQEFSTVLPDGMTKQEYEATVTAFDEAVGGFKHSESAMGEVTVEKVFKAFDPDATFIYQPGPKPDHVKDAIAHVLARHGCSRPTLTRATHAWREKLPPDDPHYRGEDEKAAKKAEKEGRVENGKAKKAKGDEDGDDWDLFALVSAVKARLRGLDPAKELGSRALEFSTELNELEAACQHATTRVGTYLRASA